MSHLNKNFLFLSLSVYLSLTLFRYIKLSLNLTLFLSINLSLYLTILLSINLSLYLTLFGSINLSLYLTLFLSINLSLYLSFPLLSLSLFLQLFTSCSIHSSLILHPIKGGMTCTLEFFNVESVYQFSITFFTYTFLHLLARKSSRNLWPDARTRI